MKFFSHQLIQLLFWGLSVNWNIPNYFIWLLLDKICISTNSNYVVKLPKSISWRVKFFSHQGAPVSTVTIPGHRVNPYSFIPLYILPITWKCPCVHYIKSCSHTHTIFPLTLYIVSFQKELLSSGSSNCVDLGPQWQEDIHRNWPSGLICCLDFCLIDEKEREYSYDTASAMLIRKYSFEEEKREYGCDTAMLIRFTLGGSPERLPPSSYFAGILYIQQSSPLHILASNTLKFTGIGHKAKIAWCSWYNMLQYDRICNNMVQYVTMWYNMLQAQNTPDPPLSRPGEALENTFTQWCIKCWKIRMYFNAVFLSQCISIFPISIYCHGLSSSCRAMSCIVSECLTLHL